MLAVLGLGPAEEDMYRRLVLRGEMRLAELAADSGLPQPDVIALLGALAELGLVASEGAVSMATESSRFAAAPPEVALGAVLRQRSDDLRAAELDLAGLVEQHRAVSHGRAAGGVVEVITDVDTVRHRFAQVQQGARHEVRSMVVPNLSVVPHRDNNAGSSSLDRGVKYRAILARDAFAQPGMFHDVVASTAAGQEIRISQHVPVKLVIADRSVAMVPLLSGQNTAAASILVRESGLLDALIEFFEVAWQLAYPLPPHVTSEDAANAAPGDIDDVDSQILALMLAGLTDQAVAGQLGISLRTVQRRLHQLMTRAGVDTRMQLGWRAARAGWA